MYDMMRGGNKKGVAPVNYSKEDVAREVIQYLQAKAVREKDLLSRIAATNIPELQKYH